MPLDPQVRKLPQVPQVPQALKDNKGHLALRVPRAQQVLWVLLDRKGLKGRLGLPELQAPPDLKVIRVHQASLVPPALREHKVLRA